MGSGEEYAGPCIGLSFLTLLDFLSIGYGCIVLFNTCLPTVVPLVQMPYLTDILMYVYNKWMDINWYICGKRH